MLLIQPLVSLLSDLAIQAFSLSSFPAVGLLTELLQILQNKTLLSFQRFSQTLFFLLVEILTFSKFSELGREGLFVLYIF
jgi:hypothetical protein